MRRDKIAGLAKALKVSPLLIMGIDDPEHIYKPINNEELVLLDDYRTLNNDGRRNFMEFADSLKEFCDRVKNLRTKIKTEEATKYTADVGIKKGENLSKHGGQLFRYFATTTAKFGILTNGIVYQFYTDLEELNKMDKAPFLTVNLL